MLEFVICQDLRGEWRWRLVAPNGRVMADSAEGYLDPTNVRDALDRILSGIGDREYSIVDAA